LVADEVLRKPLPHANTILARVNEEALSRYLADLNHGDNVSARLKRLLQERLPSGDPSQDELAALLHMTTRSLQRRLAELGTTYRELINQTRHELSLEYLAQRQHSISDIAYLLGFAEVSAFTRAFKRWTGQSPTAWREQA
jgi:AraC-like DNA-binding protein